MTLFNYEKKEEELIRENMLIFKKLVIKYLGINILKNLECLKEENLNKLKQEIKNKLDDLRKIRFSWFDRIAVCKMKIPPKINFLLRMLPIKITEEELKDW